MKFDTAEWKLFNVTRIKEKDVITQAGLFEIESCKCKCASDLDDGDEINYIGAKKNDSGVMKRVKVEQELVSKGNGILFICDGQGSVGYTNYMKDDFIGSTTTSIGYDDELNELTAMFLVTVLDKERYKYCFGRKYKRNLTKSQILLPIKKDKNDKPIIDDTLKYNENGYIPDWDFMEKYIKSLDYNKINTKNYRKIFDNIDLSTWKEFKIGSIFKKKRVYHHQSTPKEKGTIPFISSTSNNNGVSCYVDATHISGNCITVSTNGACFDCFYQPNDFAISSDVEALYCDMLNKYIALFIVSVLKLEKYKYNYGRKPKKDKVYDTFIKLPIKIIDNKPVIDKKHKYSKDGYIPDWNFMENYIKLLPYGDRI